MTKNILLGSIIESSSPAGVFDQRNLINVIFTGLLACAPIFLNSITAQLPTLQWGQYGWMLPFVALIIKSLTETIIDHSPNTI